MSCLQRSATLISLDRVLVEALLFVRPACKPKCFAKRRIHVEGRSCNRYRTFVISRKIVVPSKMDVHFKREGIKLESACAGCKGLVHASHCYQIVRVQVVSICIIGIQLERPPELSFRTLPIPFQVEPDCCE